MKPAIAFSSLFLLSLASIVAGYSDFSSFFEADHWRLVAKNAPLGKAALAFTLSGLAVLLFAFWLCRGNRITYNNAVLGYSYIAPFLVAFLVIPSATSTTSWAPSNWYFMFVCLCVAQVSITYFLREWFWNLGTGRK